MAGLTRYAPTDEEPPQWWHWLWSRTWLCYRRLAAVVSCIGGPRRGRLRTMVACANGGVALRNAAVDRRLLALTGGGACRP